jgi:membrane protein CcdC involved in cytochrome C biogenesis
VNKPVLLITIFLISIPVKAYIGPGMGGGALVAILAFFAAIFLSIWGVLYYPIKRALKNRKDRKELSKNSNNHS